MAEANPNVQVQIVKEEELSKSGLNSGEYLKGILEHMQYRSKQAHRSSNQATVFLYGKSGDGKSTTLNYLFNSQVIPTSRTSSETRNITEYGCIVKSSLWNEEKLRIGFIDTPGFGDTENRDHENLAKIAHFIKSHPKLGNSSHYPPTRNYPNIVLIVVSATDERLFGIGSGFSKMMHVLTKLNVVDVNHPNVVIVVTHAMHFTKEEFQEESKQIEIICRVMAKAHFSFEVPVIFIENIDKRREMETEGDWRILPDGTRQPLNLFDAMMGLMKQSGDEVGCEAVRVFFGKSTTYKIEEVFPIPQEIILTNLDLSTGCARWRNIIMQDFFLRNNEIYSKLSGHGVWDDFTNFPLAYNLQKVGLTTILQIQNKNLAYIKKPIHPYKLANDDIELLIQLFNITKINLKLDFQLLGMGYSRQFKENRQRVLDIGDMLCVVNGNYEMKIPKECKVKYIRDVTIDIVYDESAKWCLLEYLKITFRTSYVLLQVDIDHLEQFSLNKQFILALKKSFPKGVDPDNLEYKIENPNFSDFCKNYGLSCTTGLYFGGSIEGELWFDRKENEEMCRKFLAEKSAELSSILEYHFLRIQNGIFNSNYLQTYQPEINLFRKLSDCPLKWSGGDNKYHLKTLMTLTPEKWNKWADSIEENIVCLGTTVNSTSLFTLLSSSPEEDMRCYAREFSSITAGDQTNLIDLNFVGSLEIATGLAKDSASGRSIAGENVLTRIQASNRYMPWCVIL